jgi:hypothetical protein
MGVKLHIGVSLAPEPERAAAEAARKALACQEPPTLALVFGSEQYDPVALAAALNRELGALPWAGCCAAGVIVGEQLLWKGLAVGVFTGGLQAGVGVAGLVSTDPCESGRRAVEQALKGFSAPPSRYHRAVILLTDAFSGNAQQVVQGAIEEAGGGVAWAGGGAGDNLRFLRTAQFTGQAYRDHVVAVVLEADRPFGVGLEHGWRPYGPPVLATQTRGESVVDLDFDNAFSVYSASAASRGDEVRREHFAPFAMLHPLGIPGASGDYVIRDPISVEPDGALRCLAAVPDGSLLRVMEGEPDTLIQAAREAARASRERAGGALAFSLVFDCVSRSRVLGSRMAEELAVMQEELGDKVPMLGCLTFGEVGAQGVALPQFHNKTTVVMSLPA